MLGYNDDIPAWMQDPALAGLEQNTPEWTIAQYTSQHGFAPDATPTTLKQARELGYFGKDLANVPQMDDFISQLFQAKGLSEQQAVDAAIQGKKNHQAQFGQGYTTASSIGDIFNSVLTSAGVAADDRLSSLPGFSDADAESRGKKAADIEHGGDFGSATGLGQILSYQSNLGGNVLEAWKQDPERALLGINTPAESSIWGGVLGKDYRPTVDMTGGSTEYDTQSAQAKGIDTQSGEAMQQIAKTLALKFGGNAINGLFSSGGESIAGSTGDSSAIGGAGNDTLSQNVPTGQNEGNGMWDWLDGIDSEAGFDPGSSSMYNAPLTEDTSTGAFDQFGMNNPNTGFQDQGFDPGGSFLDSLKGYGQQGVDLYNKLKSIPGLAQLLGGAAGAAGGKKSTGGGILDNILNDPLGAAFNASPFLLAANFANKQAGDLNGVLNSINQDSYRKSVLDPYDLETGQGRAMMQQDQGLRGVAGSSFGDQSLNNYDYMRNLGRGDMASKANLSAAGIQGSLINARNTNTNMLLGAGLNASGRLFSPPSDFESILKKAFGV